MACALVVLALAIRYHGGQRPGGLDEAVYSYLTRLGMPRGPLMAVVDAVPPTFGAVVVVLAAVLAARRRWRAAVLAAVGPGLALLVTEVGKRVVGRSLDGTLALPSGHTTGVASVVAMIAVLRIARARRVGRAAVLGLGAVTLAAAAVGIAMVPLGFHYATDIIAGYCVGVAVPLAVALAIDGVSHPIGEPGAWGSTAGAPQPLARSRRGVHAPDGWPPLSGPPGGDQLLR